MVIIVRTLRDMTFHQQAIGGFYTRRTATHEVDFKLDSVKPGLNAMLLCGSMFNIQNGLNGSLN